VAVSTGRESKEQQPSTEYMLLLLQKYPEVLNSIFSYFLGLINEQIAEVY